MKNTTELYLSRYIVFDCSVKNFEILFLFQNRRNRVNQTDINLVCALTKTRVDMANGVLRWFFYEYIL